MKLMKSLLASALLIAGTSALAAPQVQSVVLADQASGTEAHRLWSNVCVGNLKLVTAVKAQYKYDAQTVWQDVEIAPNTLLIFSQRFATDLQPMKLTLKFKTPQTDAGAELSYDLNETVTRFRPARCDNVENYGFEGADGDATAIDLVHAQ